MSNEINETKNLSLAQMGIAPGSEGEAEEQEEQEETELEAEDAEETQETSVDEEMSETLNEEAAIEEDSDDVGEVEEDSEIADLTKRLKAAEDGLKNFQSKADSENYRNNQFRNELQVLYNEYNKLKTSIAETEETQALDDLGADDDLMTVGQMKALSKKKPASADNSQQVQNPQLQWLEMQPDISEVVDYATKNLAQDQEFNSIPPSELIGRYYSAKARLDGEKSQKVQAAKDAAAKKKLLAKKQRGSVPRVGGGRGKKFGGGAPQDLNDFGKQLLAFGNRIGKDLAVK